MYLRRTLACIAALAVLAVGCNRSASLSDSGAPDADSDTDADSDSDTDTDTETESQSDSDTGECGDDWVGLPCEPPGEDMPDPCWELACSYDAFCYAFDGGEHGLCTLECSPATYEVPVQEGCPSFDGYVCADISGLTAWTGDDETGFGICLEECVSDPQGQPGPCKSSHIRCDPWSWAWESQFATCLLPKCESDADCPVVSGPTCAGDGDCDATEGETCSEDGLCVFEGDCDAASGRCTWEAGDPDAEPGDPCETAHDCGANSICLQPSEDSDGKIAPANGYCASFGCKAVNNAAPNGSGSSDAAIHDEFGCGMLGTCHAGYHSGGMCTKRCNPPHDQAEFRCRQQSWDSEFLDVNGDYDCYDQTSHGYPIYTTGNTEFYPAASAPYCTWVTAWPSSYGPPAKCGDGEDEVTPEECADFHGGFPVSWGLGMTCRDPLTGELDDFGYCLDNTTSGPTETWDTDTET